MSVIWSGTLNLMRSAMEIVVNYIMYPSAHRSCEGRQSDPAPEEASADALCGSRILGWILIELCRSRGDGACTCVRACVWHL